MKQESLYIVIPAYNEEESIAAVIDDWYPFVAKASEDSRLVINCSGSRDKTADIIQQKRKECPQIEIQEDSRNTYRDKLLDLYRFAVARSPDFVFQTDSDRQTDPKDFLPFWDNRADFDVQIGRRVHRGDGRIRRLIQTVECAVIGVFFRVKVPDANTPFRLMRTDLLRVYMEQIPQDYSMPNMMLTAFFAADCDKIAFPAVAFVQRQKGKNTMNLRTVFRCGFESLKAFSKAGKACRRNRKRQKDTI